MQHAVALIVQRVMGHYRHPQLALQFDDARGALGIVRAFAITTTISLFADLEAQGLLKCFEALVVDLDLGVDAADARR